MSDKTGQTIYEPAAKDVQSITLIIEDGVVTGIETGVAVRQNDTRTSYRCDPDSLKSLPADYSQAIQDALAAFPAAVAANVAAKEGF